MKKRVRKCSVLFHCVPLALLVAAPVRACPMCKDGVTAPAGSTSASAPAEAAVLDFNTSIYVMLSVVAVVATTVGRVMVKAVRG